MHGWGLGLAASVTIHGREHVVVAAAVYEAGMPAGLPLAIDALPALENVTNM
jgi:NAD(P)H-dependent FMN reductase